jgi:NADH:ubiquinone oxidoreductase subunit 2 (subunit N)
LRLLVVMYMYEPGEVANNIEPLTPGLRAALILPAIGTIFLGVLPGAVLNFAQRSTIFGAR